METNAPALLKSGKYTATPLVDGLSPSAVLNRALASASAKPIASFSVCGVCTQTHLGSFFGRRFHSPHEHPNRKVDFPKRKLHGAVIPDTEIKSIMFCFRETLQVSPCSEVRVRCSSECLRDRPHTHPRAQSFSPRCRSPSCRLTRADSGPTPLSKRRGPTADPPQLFVSCVSRGCQSVELPPLGAVAECPTLVLLSPSPLFPPVRTFGVEVRDLQEVSKAYFARCDSTAFADSCYDGSVTACLSDWCSSRSFSFPFLHNGQGIIISSLHTRPPDIVRTDALPGAFRRYCRDAS